METYLVSDRSEMGRLVAARAAEDLRLAIQLQGAARLVVATGASQFEVLKELVRQPDLDWKCVSGFHLDEYLGLSPEHPASFCRYLNERFVTQVPLAEFHFLRGDQDPHEVIAAAKRAIAAGPIDVALVGIGENGHLAFNDPPADFETEEPYLIVPLDQRCRQQQVGEGWFSQLAEVPTHAISMSVQQIMKSQRIYCSVPDRQKAPAIQATLEGEICPAVPASILRTHKQAMLVIDEASSSLLSDATKAELRR